MTSDVRRLIVMRHAKTEPTASTDRSRRLTDRGRADARAAGRMLAESGLTPTAALVSPAVRAQQTFEQVVDGFGAAVALTTYDELYGADEHEVVELCTRLASPIHTALVIGHNPTMAGLVHALQESPPQDWPDPLPTSGFAVLTISGDWSELELRSAAWETTQVPRG